MNIAITALCLIAPVSWGAALILRTITRKQDLARARRQADEMRLSALEERVSSLAHSLNTLWQEVNYPTRRR